MFKIRRSSQTDNHNFRKNVATTEKCILRKMGLKFGNPKLNISCKKALYILFIKCEPFGVKRSMRSFWKIS